SLLLILLRKKLGTIGGRRLILDFSKISLASLLMGGGLLFFKNSLLNFDFKLEFIRLFLLILIGILIYGIVISILLKEERERLKSIVKRYLKRVVKF
ncbi:MAG TPA: hypothetical protein PK487_08615, partial [bacterium]|nr:hypothetical protein [bacterium]